jgi:hypothetical protein
MVTLTVEPFRYAATASKDFCCVSSSSKSIEEIWPLTPKNVALVGSMKFTFIKRLAFGNENPRSITPLTTLNIVVTPAMPSARTITARAQNPFSLIRTRRPILTSRNSVSASIAFFFL